VENANAEVHCTVSRSQKNGEKSPETIRTELVGRLRARRPEIEKAVVARIRRVSEPTRDEDPAYVAGVLDAVVGALDYGLEGLEKGAEISVPIPDKAAKQARRAARDAVRLETVLRRYAAGSKSLEEFIVAEADGIPSEVLCQILSDHGLQVDRLMESVAAEYRDEREQMKRSSAQKQADRIVHFLNGASLIPPAGVDYDFDAWHIAMILRGHTEVTARALRGLAGRHGYRLLSVVRDHETAWTWLGASSELDGADLARSLSTNLLEGSSAALGEPRKGIDGWRQTFREAQAALQIMLYCPQPVTRCKDVILVSAVMKEPALATSLIETFLTPLDGRRDTGAVLRRTLRAYFKADQNANSAAAALGVARHTVERHLRSVEEKLGQTLDTCGAQLQVALGVEEVVIASNVARPSGSA